MQGCPTKLVHTIGTSTKDGSTGGWRGGGGSTNWRHQLKNTMIIVSVSFVYHCRSGDYYSPPYSDTTQVNRFQLILFRKRWFCRLAVASYRYCQLGINGRGDCCVAVAAALHNGHAHRSLMLTGLPYNQMMMMTMLMATICVVYESIDCNRSRQHWRYR